jgi:hypothetical protein
MKCRSPLAASANPGGLLTFHETRVLKLRRRDLHHIAKTHVRVKEVVIGLEEVIMGHWKMFFLGTVLGSALTLVIVHFNSNALELVGSAALAAHDHPGSGITDPITPTEGPRGAKTPEEEPWGPIRTVDW